MMESDAVIKFNRGPKAFNLIGHTGTGIATDFIPFLSTGCLYLRRGSTESSAAKIPDGGIEQPVIERAGSRPATDLAE